MARYEAWNVSSGQMGGAGFVRGSRILPAPLCGLLREESLAALEARRYSISYHWWRLWGSAVNTPKRRHIIKLPMSDSLREAVSAIARWHTKSIHEHSDGPRFSWRARLVELCVVITLPGAPMQRRHTDVLPYSTDAESPWTTWVALQDVKEDMGPTIIYPYSHTRHGERIKQEALTQRHYNASGELEYVTCTGKATSHPIISSTASQHCSSGPPGDAQASSGPQGPEPAPVKMCMQTGDGCVMDARVFHHGAANLSSMARVLLNVTFQEDNARHSGDDRFQRTDGFTYHIDSSVESAGFRLGDFDN